MQKVIITLAIEADDEDDAMYVVRGLQRGSVSSLYDYDFEVTNFETWEEGVGEGS